MTLDEALKELERWRKKSWPGRTAPLKEAVGLGIEALKRLIENRRSIFGRNLIRLPGETAEKKEGD